MLRLKQNVEGNARSRLLRNYVGSFATSDELSRYEVGSYDNTLLTAMKQLIVNEYLIYNVEIFYTVFGLGFGARARLLG